MQIWDYYSERIMFNYVRMACNVYNVLCNVIIYKPLLILDRDIQ